MSDAEIEDVTPELEPVVIPLVGADAEPLRPPAADEALGLAPASATHPDADAPRPRRANNQDAEVASASDAD
jgi:hypothetical protein